jgi:hypothetical protein
VDRPLAHGDGFLTEDLTQRRQGAKQDRKEKQESKRKVPSATGVPFLFTFPAFLCGLALHLGAFA